MDKKIIIALATITLLIILYIGNLNQQKNYENTGSDFLNLDKNLITKIIISANDDAIEFNTTDSLWNISGNDSLVMKPNKIQNLLSSLESLKTIHTVTTKEEKWSIYGVDAPSGTHLALVGNGGNTLAYYVFGQANEYNKCYVRTDKNMEVYLLDSNIMFQLRTDPNFWGQTPKEEVMPDSLKATPSLTF